VAGQCLLKKGSGVFYEGRRRAFLLDKNGDKVKEMPEPVSVTPLRPLALAKVWMLTPDEQVPANAVKAALYLYDAKAEIIGELAHADIRR
jgi:hypothetical protein